ncbi:MAG TPA: hypothetical protein VIJ95_07550 [Hanamia sp.]
MRISSVLIILLTAFTIFSCKKSPFEDPALVGKWKMIEVRDNTNDTVFTKPASVNENVEIVFSYSSSGKGEMIGNATIAPVRGSFTVGEQRTISIPLVYYDIDKVGFDIFWGSSEWDSEFLNNITISKSYFFDSSGNLNINTTNNTTIVFTKE